MHFLNPAFLTGLLIAGIPLLTHLLRHRRVQQVRFSTLEFLKLLHKRHSLRIRISQWLLLLARMGLAAALTLVFAQPYFTAPSMQFLNAGPRQVVAVLDNSGSMGVVAREGRTLYQEALEEVRRLAAGLSPRDALTVVALAPRARVSFRGRPEDFRTVVAPAPSAAAADVEGAARLAAGAFEERPGSERQLVVFSDFSRFSTGPLAGLQCETLLFPFRADGVSNRSVGAIAADAERLVAGDTATFRLTLGRHGAPSRAKLVFSVPDRPEEVRIVAAGAGPTQVAFASRFEKAGFVPVSVRTEPDALPGDDVAQTVVEVLAQRRVVVVTGRPLPPGEGVRDPLFFLRRGLEGAALDVTDAPERLEGASLVVLLRPDLLDATHGRLLAEHARRGGNVITFLSPDEIDVGAANRNWFDLLGAMRLGRKVEGVAPWRGAGGGDARGWVDSRAWESVASSARFLVEPGPGPRRQSALVAFDDATPAVVSGPLGRGLLTVVNAGVGLEGSDLPLHPVFPIFLSRLLAWSPEGLTVATAGEEVSFTVPVEEFAGQFQVVAPGGRVHSLAPQRRGKQLSVGFDATEVPGLYRFERVLTGRRTTQWFVVRWPESESALEYPADAELTRQFPRAKLGAATSGAAWTGRLPFSVSDLLLAVAIFLILAETWLVFDLERQIARDLPSATHE